MDITNIDQSLNSQKEAGYVEACRDIYEGEGCPQCRAQAILGANAERTDSYCAGMALAAHFVLESKHVCAPEINPADMNAFLMGKRVKTSHKVIAGA